LSDSEYLTGMDLKLLTKAQLLEIIKAQAAAINDCHEAMSEMCDAVGHHARLMSSSLAVGRRRYAQATKPLEIFETVREQVAKVKNSRQRNNHLR
jgi:hypothetical protein